MDAARPNPLPWLLAAAGAFDLRGGRTIVEIGGLRHQPNTPECDANGGSVLVWAQHTHADRIYTVDVDPRVVELTRRYVPESTPGPPGAGQRVYPVCGDGIAFLESFAQPIDLLYLDAWDVSPDPAYQENHLRAFTAALKNLHEGSLVLIDDADFPDLGKAKLVIPAARRHGFELWWLGRQAMLGRGLRAGAGRV